MKKVCGSSNTANAHKAVRGQYGPNWLGERWSMIVPQPVGAALRVNVPNQQLLIAKVRTWETGQLARLNHAMRVKAKQEHAVQVILVQLNCSPSA
jgi:hypothetical protein